MAVSYSHVLDLCGISEIDHHPAFSKSCLSYHFSAPSLPYTYF